MDSLTIGIIGLGGAGRAHAHRFRQNKYVRDTLAYDPKTPEVNGVRTFSDLEEFLNLVDAVSICTPDYTHYDYIVRSMEAGKHVLVEKPMVASVEEAIALEDVLREHPELKFAVHHQMRFVPAFQKAKELINEGEFGDIFYMEANYWHDMRARNELFDDWRIRGKGQSVIFGGACHPLDLLLYLSGDEIVSHKTFLNKNAYPGYPGAYTSATTTFRFKNDVVAKCHSNNCVIFPQMNNLVVLGDKASLIDGVLYKDSGFEVLSGYHTKKDNPTLFERMTQTWPSSAILKFLPKQRLFRTNPFSVYNHEFACMVVIDNFVDAVLRDEPVLVGYQDGRRVIQLCQETEDDGLAGWTGP